MITDSLLEKLRAWSYCRQGLHGEREAPLETLQRVVAVYSSNPTAPLSLVARNRNLDPDRFAELEQDRHAIRLPAMRGSIFFVPVVAAGRLLAATATPMEKLRGRLEYGGMSWEDYQEIKTAFLEKVTAPKTTEELQELIPVQGKLMVAIRILAYEGLALRVGNSPRGDSFTYVSTPSWLGESIPEMNSDESLAWLASEYLRAFGPARVADFAWWSGVTKTRARKAVAACETQEIENGLYILSSDFEAWARQEPLSGDEIAALPKWDAYAMGYQSEGRARFVDDRDQPLAYPKIRATSGDGAPLVLRGGKAVASWGHRFSGDRMTVSVTPFDPSDNLTWLPETAFERAGDQLGATDITVKVGSQ